MTDEKIEVEETLLQKIERQRAERQADRKRQREEQRAIDMAALFELECTHGDSNVGHVELPWEPGLPTLAAVITPTKPLFKRYQDKIKNNPKDTSGPAEEIGEACNKYPDAEMRAKLYELRPGLRVELGVLALTLTTGRIADEGKG